MQVNNGGDFLNEFQHKVIFVRFEFSENVVENSNNDNPESTSSQEREENTAETTSHVNQVELPDNNEASGSASANHVIYDGKLMKQSTHSITVYDTQCLT